MRLRLDPACLVPFILATSATGCTPTGLPGQSTDASRFFDVELPDTSLPDSFILTQVGVDGGTTEIDPGDPCELDSGADVATGASEATTTTQPDASHDASRDATLDAQTDGLARLVPNACETPLAAGDLLFDEVMISSVSGSSDLGQWLEVRSTRACSVDLVGLHASAPHGTTFRTMDVTTDVWLPPGGFFLIADTLEPAENNDLPGLVLAWTGSPPDALHKTSDTVTLSIGAVTLDTLTYPDKERAEGTSMAFPAHCSPGLRTDFTSWAPSNASWTPGFFGTPGAPNTDVTCSVPMIPTCTPAPRRRSRE